jgi:ATPase subunit of ABC transporter with duplicated ATPase domains
LRIPGTLAARGLTKAHGDRVVLDAVSVVVAAGARLGVVGPNGIGKSTLLRLLAGLDEPDAGVVERSPPSLGVAYLAQEADVAADETLFHYVARRTGVAVAEQEMDGLAARLGEEPELAGAYAGALDGFLARGGEDLEARARTVLSRVGLDPERLHDVAGALSGGEAARLALAALLLTRADVLLLDEPTNDLDFAGLDLLERFIAETDSAVVVVSHDRTLLERTVQRVLELRPGGEPAREYAGGFAEYERARDTARRAHYEAWGAYVGEKERLEEQARRRAEWVVRATTHRRKKKTRDIRGQVRREIERLERVDKPWEPWELRLSLEARRRTGDVVAQLTGAVVERGAFRLGPVDLDLRWQDRLAVVGANGSGKSTLLAALLGRVPLAAGTRTLGSGIVLGELDQARATMSGGEPLVERTRGLAGNGLTVSDARTLLAKFDLGADDVLRPCSSLSPGERTRAALAVFAAQGVNVVVLDEPTNHLDLPAIEQLEEALAGYDGTAVVVSHDRRFLERFGATWTLEL